MHIFVGCGIMSVSADNDAGMGGVMMRVSRCRSFFVLFSFLLILAALVAIAVVTATASANTIDNILPEGGIRYTSLTSPVATGSVGKADEEVEMYADLSTTELLNHVLSFEGVGGYVMFKSTRTYTESDVARISKNAAFSVLVEREDYADVLELYAAGRQSGEDIGTVASDTLPYVTLHPLTVNALRGRRLTPEFAAYIREALETVGLAE